jgi:segregation and condensation protein B
MPFANLHIYKFAHQFMEISNLIPHIEALIFASDKPLTPIDITELINNAFGFMEDKVTLDQVEASIEGIVEKYNSEFYPFEVKQSGGGWQFLTKKDFHKTIAQLNGEKFLKRLSAAALETLAIIAYKQPITKGEIETIRGVSTDYTIQKLLEKELIIISGRNEQLPGHPLIYSTSKSFMDYFGVNSADDLPKIKEVLANQLMEGTVINHTEFEQASTLAVTDDGELIEEAPTSEDLITENENKETLNIVSSDLEISESPEENVSNDEFSPEESSQGEMESESPEENEGSDEDNSSTDESSDGNESTSSEEQQ